LKGARGSVLSAVLHLGQLEFGSGAEMMMMMMMMIIIIIMMMMMMMMMTMIMMIMMVIMMLMILSPQVLSAVLHLGQLEFGSGSEDDEMATVKAGSLDVAAGRGHRR
jgi:hypothetical protein